MRLVNAAGTEIQEIDFGVVEIGKEKTVECFIENETEAFIENLSLEVDNEEVSCTTVPQNMEPFEKLKLIFSWKPTLKKRKGLKTKVIVKADSIWKP